MILATLIFPNNPEERDGTALVYVLYADKVGVISLGKFDEDNAEDLVRAALAGKDADGVRFVEHYELLDEVDRRLAIKSAYGEAAPEAICNIVRSPYQKGASFFYYHAACWHGPAEEKTRRFPVFEIAPDATCCRCCGLITEPARTDVVETCDAWLDAKINTARAREERAVRAMERK